MKEANEWKRKIAFWIRFYQTCCSISEWMGNNPINICLDHLKPQNINIKQMPLTNLLVLLLLLSSLLSTASHIVNHFYIRFHRFTVYHAQIFNGSSDIQTALLGSFDKKAHNFRIIYKYVWILKFHSKSMHIYHNAIPANQNAISIFLSTEIFKSKFIWFEK